MNLNIPTCKFRNDLLCNVLPMFKNHKYCKDHSCIEYGCENERAVISSKERSSLSNTPLIILNEYCQNHNQLCFFCKKLVYKDNDFLTNTLHFNCACLLNICTNPKTNIHNGFCSKHQEYVAKKIL